MLRALALAAAFGVALTTAPAASATVKLYCASAGRECMSWSCPAGTTTVFDSGFSSGPWLVLCRPNV